MTVVHVAVGVIVNSDNQVLIAKRAKNQHQGNKWEFPGGKVESGENSQEALQREIREELGIQIKSAILMTDILHQYKDKMVFLDVYSVNDWHGEVNSNVGKEGQPLRWVEKQDLINYEFPAANSEILSCLVNP